MIALFVIVMLGMASSSHYLEVLVRTRVSRCRMDMRVIATAMEEYSNDWGDAPPDYDGIGLAIMDEGVTWKSLTTPLAYMTSIIDDPFQSNSWKDPTGSYKRTPYFLYWKIHAFMLPERYVIWERNNIKWAMNSIGPDAQSNNLGSSLLYSVGSTAKVETLNRTYNPSNGVISKGDICWSNRGEIPGGFVILY